MIYVFYFQGPVLCGPKILCYKLWTVTQGPQYFPQAYMHSTHIKNFLYTVCNIITSKVTIIMAGDKLLWYIIVVTADDVIAIISSIIIITDILCCMCFILTH